MTEDVLIRSVAKAILESDPTCNYEACRQRIEGAPNGSDLNWWRALHRQAENAIKAVRSYDEAKP